MNDNDLKSEFSDISNVCKKYGYGNVMSFASALWRQDFRNKGIPTDGCFVPTLNSFIKDDCKFDEEQQKYDRLVEKLSSQS